MKLGNLFKPSSFLLIWFFFDRFCDNYLLAFTNYSNYFFLTIQTANTYSLEAPICLRNWMDQVGDYSEVHL